MKQVSGPNPWHLQHSTHNAPQQLIAYHQINAIVDKIASARFYSCNEAYCVDSRHCLSLDYRSIEFPPASFSLCTVYSWSACRAQLG